MPGSAVWDRPAAAVAGAIRTASVSVATWLTDLPRRAGDRLFAKNDEEAGWRGWQVTVLNGGLARKYRDARFDTLRDRLDPHGGRVEPGQDSGGRRVEAVPEAWDDHWNGCPLGGDR